MYHHSPDCLQGPRFRTRDWWMQTALPGHPLNGKEEAPIRWNLVERVRQAIAAGTYDTPEAWEEALNRLLASVDA